MKYCLRNLATRTDCYNCGRPLPGGLTGYLYNHPLCVSCFEQCDPELASLLPAITAFDLASLQVPPHPGVCAGCRRAIDSWIIGRRGQELFCRRCFAECDPHLASVLVLEEAARSLVNDRAPASQLMELVRRYADLQVRGGG